ncbi:unnamed protein product [Prorocentrum cordatum]|uniref:Uncharacterized protein n=1 Tax=Prorocentrum cordatum TaxID=2364126 RepID=A0ABN9TY96_9DINO|nr:unnamed protein product [Polarella glacialis]
MAKPTHWAPTVSRKCLYALRTITPSHSMAKPTHWLLTCITRSVPSMALRSLQEATFSTVGEGICKGSHTHRVKTRQSKAATTAGIRASRTPVCRTRSAQCFTAPLRSMSAEQRPQST